MPKLPAARKPAPPPAPAPPPPAERAPVPITWHYEIMAGATYERGTAEGVAGLYYRRDLPAGAAELTESAGGQPYLTYVCPCGCSQVGSLPLAPSRALGQKGWDWDTSLPDPRTLPTLSPSIAKKYGCRWHGFLKAGIWSTCANWVEGVG